MSKIAKRMIHYAGKVKFTDLPKEYQASVEGASKAMEAKYPRVVDAKIQGSKPHPSHKDKSDKKDCITVSYHTESGSRVTSVHAHSDKTYNEFPSRNAGRGKAAPKSKGPGKK